MWNQLPNQIKESETISKFKHNLSNQYAPTNVPIYYFVGTRKGQILHARLRMACSSLKHHLYLKNIENDPYCLYGEIETTSHYILHCHHLRVNLENELNFPITYNVLLFGEADRDFEFNKKVFIAVQNLILNTKRFSWLYHIVTQELTISQLLDIFFSTLIFYSYLVFTFFCHSYLYTCCSRHIRSVRLGCGALPIVSAGGLGGSGSAAVAPVGGTCALHCCEARVALPISL